MIILFYIDDVILTSNDTIEIPKMKQFLDNSFKIKDLGDLQFFLRIEIARNNTSISLWQRKYALKVLYDIDYLAFKPANTPMDTHLNLDNESGTLLGPEDSSSYKKRKK